MHLNQTSVSNISNSVSHLAPEIGLCVKRFQEFGLDCHRTAGLIQQRAASSSTKADEAKAHQLAASGKRGPAPGNRKILFKLSDKGKNLL